MTVIRSDVYRELIKEKIPDEKLNLHDYEKKCVFVRLYGKIIDKMYENRQSNKSVFT
jgi:hypothetical protein